MLYEETGMRRL